MVVTMVSDGLRQNFDWCSSRTRFCRLPVVKIDSSSQATIKRLKP